MERVNVEILDANHKGYERKKISIICEQPKDQFKETHSLFTNEQRKEARLNHKNKK